MQTNENAQILAVRQFNRFYTREFGFLHKRILDNSYSLMEARVLYELANNPPLRASDIAESLSLDAGYLSRTLKQFEKNNILTKVACEIDGRSTELHITDHGREEADRLAALSNAEVQEKLVHLSAEEIEQLTEAMKAIENTLQHSESPTIVIRSQQSGDMGWMLEVHGAFYKKRYGYNSGFEALVAQIIADFLASHDNETEHCWIAEVDGRRAGSVMLVQGGNGVAKLRLLYVEPWARGLKLGQKLVETCQQFARNAGYVKIMLWTNAALQEAGNLYKKLGFTLGAEETHTKFGTPQTGQTYECAL